ncbi:ParA family protein [Williamsia sp. MIQD14]|uniref:ParA family protein n=1 Tax=Williamsia sp. MIQD14 TaxID=3425703 RepID=UPI003DA0A70D
MAVLAFCNQKGGSTKTATTIGLAAALSEAGVRALLIDLDPQANLTTGLGVDPEEAALGANDVLAEAASIDEAVVAAASSWRGIDVLAGGESLANRESDAAMDIHYRLRNALARSSTTWDHILIDTSPFVGRLMANGLTASDQVIIPTDASSDGARGVDAITKSVELARRSFNERLQTAAIVIGRRERNGEQDFRENELRAKYGSLVAKTVIPKRAAVGDAHGLSTPIYSMKGQGALAVASAYRDLARELHLI